jgi:hypothetical protein
MQYELLDYCKPKNRIKKGNEWKGREKTPEKFHLNPVGFYPTG